MLEVEVEVGICVVGILMGEGCRWDKRDEGGGRINEQSEGVKERRREWDCRWWIRQASPEAKQADLTSLTPAPGTASSTKGKAIRG